MWLTLPWSWWGVGAGAHGAPGMPGRRSKHQLTPCFLSLKNLCLGCGLPVQTGSCRHLCTWYDCGGLSCLLFLHALKPLETVRSPCLLSFKCICNRFRLYLPDCSLQPLAFQTGNVVGSSREKFNNSTHLMLEGSSPQSLDTLNEA